MITTAVEIFVFALGALFGSFFALCVHRLILGISIVRPASRCEGCKTPIPWYHNIPVLSYLLLWGRCRACGVKIGLRNWLVEVGTGLVALILWRRFGLPGEELIWLSGPEAARATWPFLAVFAFFGAMLVASLIDLETLLLPNAITLPGIPLGILLSQALPEQSLRGAVVGAAVGFLGLWILRKGYAWFTGREGIGLGDVYLMGTIGGFVGISKLPVVLLLGSIQGSLVGIVMALLARRRQRGAGEPMRFYQIPFGPFLALAAMEVILYGREMLDWYWGRLL